MLVGSAIVSMPPRIVSAAISPMPQEVWDPLPVITATFSDGSVKKLFSYFPDEISFLPSELVGLTEEEARGAESEEGLGLPHRRLPTTVEIPTTSTAA